MARAFGKLATILLVYAAIHPFAYLGAQWYATRGWDLPYEVETKLDTVTLDGTDYRAVDEDGEPLISQLQVGGWSPVLAPRNVLVALLLSVAIVGISALCAIAARALEQGEAPA